VENIRPGQLLDFNFMSEKCVQKEKISLKRMMFHQLAGLNAYILTR